MKVFILAGQTNIAGMGRIRDLRDAIRDPETSKEFDGFNKSPKDLGSRTDVWLSALDASSGKRVSSLVEVGQTGNSVGPTIGIGHVLGEHFEQPVLLIRVHSGPGSLNEGFRPPSSGGKTGKAYLAIIKEVKNVLRQLSNVGIYKNTGYQIEGFVWFQGWNDSLQDDAADAYQSNLSNLFADLRKDLNAPDLHLVVGEFGLHGDLSTLKKPVRERVKKIRDAQKAVCETTEFADVSLFVPTSELVRKWPPKDRRAFLYFEDGLTLYRIGTALGKGLVKLDEVESEKPGKQKQN